MGVAWTSAYLPVITVEVGRALLSALGEGNAASFRSLCLQPGILPSAPRLPDSGFEDETFLSFPVPQGYGFSLLWG